MPRRSAAEKAETHSRIIEQASRTFRREGLSAGILPLMKSVGLTSGGFYKHFGSKDQLFLEALAFGYDETTNEFEQAARSAPAGQELRAIIHSYLRDGHVDHPDHGCTIAALGSEIDRQEPATRRAAQALTRDFMLRFIGYLPGKTHREREDNFYVLFSTMVGAVTLARSLSDPRARKRVLELNRVFLVSTFCNEP